MYTSSLFFLQGPDPLRLCLSVHDVPHCRILSPWQNWMAAYLGFTLRMNTLFRGWPIMDLWFTTRIREEEEEVHEYGINIGILLSSSRIWKKLDVPTIGSLYYRPTVQYSIQYIYILYIYIYIYIAVLVFQCLTGHAPAYLADDCQLAADASARRLRSADTAKCVVRRTYNIFGDRCFAAAGPRLWNTRGRWKCRTRKWRTWKWRTKLQGWKMQDLKMQDRLCLAACKILAS